MICPIVLILLSDVVGLCETKLDVSKYSVRTVSKSFRRHFRRTRHAASTSPIPFEGYYKPGGTMTMCINHSTSRYIPSSKIHLVDGALSLSMASLAA